ncbi:glycosyltransferase family 4 protein [Candidatus Gottesmanbacteria bacterium]|nr:glycosyltransferase family 4 protein [Candidatus Gottesmanbacteria bacterium]
MRVLQVNKFYHIVGGTDRNFLELSSLLTKKKNRVALFSMKDNRNYSSPWEKYFVSNVDLSKKDFLNSLKVISRIFYSLEAKKKINLLLDDFKPDIAHVHQIYHHISPSILLELKKRNIPIVHTVSDYHLISPHHNNLFHNGKICEVSKVRRFYNTVLHKCVKDSYLASFVEAVEQYFHRLFGFYSNTIDYYIAPSRFLEKKLIEYNIPERKICHIPYFIHADKYEPDFTPGRYVLYFGRLSSEKGLLFLTHVIEKLPKIKFKIIGDGIEKDNLVKIKNQKQLNNLEIISRFIPENELKGYIRKSRFTILPSESYEIFGISPLEAFALGKLVVTSDMGALPEVNRDGETGFVFQSGKVNNCIEKISKLWYDKQLCKRLGKNARNYVEKYFGPEEHYEKLMAIYKEAIAKHK